MPRNALSVSVSRATSVTLGTRWRNQKSHIPRAQSHPESHPLHKTWLTQEADAKSWSSLKHVQPKEGRKELAPREIKFRYRRLDTTIRERAGSSQEGRKRVKDTPGYFLCFFFLFIPNSRCSRQKSSRHGRDESRQESSMGTVKGSPTISIRLFVGYGQQ